MQQLRACSACKPAIASLLASSHVAARRPDDLTLVTMRKPGEPLTWDNQTFKAIPEYSWVPQCVPCQSSISLSRANTTAEGQPLPLVR